MDLTDGPVLTRGAHVGGIAWNPVSVEDVVESLHGLVYVSSAVRAVTVEDLRHLLVRAQERNRQQGVTGVLLYDAGNFMQYIEGPKAGLLEVYGHIQRDPLHSGIIELCIEEPRARLFADWAMGARISNTPEFSPAWLHDPLLDARLGGLPDAAGGGAVLLRGFWARTQYRGLGGPNP